MTTHTHPPDVVCQRCTRDRLQELVNKYQEDGKTLNPEDEQEFRMLGNKLIVQPGEIFDLENLLRVLRNDPIH